jgi:hypothetical protein
MKAESTTSRAASLLVAATTVVALMATAAGAERGGPVEGRLASAQEPSGAGVIAVVLAAARDLLLPEHSASTVAAPLGYPASVTPSARRSVSAGVHTFVPPQAPLGDRWLDLPPPIC